jgi:uncharacterized membrane protein
MNRRQQPAVALFAIGLIGLGVLALLFGDFALVWQPVAPWIPGRTALAYASGVLMLGGGAGLLFEATAAWAARILCPYFVLWAGLKVPALFAAPGTEAVWLGLGELTLLLAGGWTLFAVLSDISADSWLKFAVGVRGLRLARLLFSVSLPPIGLSHLVYAQVTADYVPAWLPWHLGWAYLTGVGQIAAGLGVLFRVFPRVAAWAEAGMIAAFTLLLWLPAVAEAPKIRLNWTAFFISWIIGAAACAVAQNVPAKAAVKEHEPALELVKG